VSISPVLVTGILMRRLVPKPKMFAALVLSCQIAVNIRKNLDLGVNLQNEEEQGDVSSD